MLTIEAHGKRVTVPGITAISVKKSLTRKQSDVAREAYAQGVRDALRAVQAGRGAVRERELMGEGD